MHTDLLKKYSQPQLEPGSYLGTKVVEGWEINDDDSLPWVEYTTPGIPMGHGQRCEKVIIFFQDGSVEYAILARWESATRDPNPCVDISCLKR
jgi:hypothetical protein